MKKENVLLTLGDKHAGEIGEGVTTPRDAIVVTDKRICCLGRAAGKSGGMKLFSKGQGVNTEISIDAVSAVVYSKSTPMEIIIRICIGFGVGVPLLLTGLLFFMFSMVPAIIMSVIGVFFLIVGIIGVRYLKMKILTVSIVYDGGVLHSAFKDVPEKEIKNFQNTVLSLREGTYTKVQSNDSDN